MNDPLGLTWYNGVYHLFAQYVPDSPGWTPEIGWGHTTSPNLLQWTELTPALEPSRGEQGAWSGSVIVNAGKGLMFYSGVAEDLAVSKVRRAVPTDATWSSWVPQEVVAELPAGYEATAFRDPYVFRDGHMWRMVVGAGLVDGTGTAFSFISTDLHTWHPDGQVAERLPDEPPVWTGTGWECPQLIRVNGQWVLVISAWEPSGGHDVVYAIGDLSDGRFNATTWGQLTYGTGLYAGSVFTDRTGEPGIIHWIRGISGDAWAGAHSVPHRLRLEGTRLYASPHPEIDEIRGTAQTVQGPVELPLPPISDLIWVSSDGTLTIQGIRIQVTSDSVEVRIDGGLWSMPHDGTVRIICDTPIVEVFAGGGVLAGAVEALDSVEITDGKLTVHELKPAN